MGQGVTNRYTPLDDDKKGVHSMDILRAHEDEKGVAITDTPGGLDDDEKGIINNDTPGGLDEDEKSFVTINDEKITLDNPEGNHRQCALSPFFRCRNYVQDTHKPPYFGCKARSPRR